MKKLLLFICLLSLLSLAPSPNVPRQESKHRDLVRYRYEVWHVLWVGWEGNYNSALVDHPNNYANSTSQCAGLAGRIYYERATLRPGTYVLFKLYDDGPGLAKALWWWPDYRTMAWGNGGRNVPTHCTPDQLRALAPDGG